MNSLIYSLTFDTLLAYGLFLVTIIGCLMAFVGKMREETIRSTYSDPHTAMVKQLLTKISDLKAQSWPDYQRNKKQVLSDISSVLSSLSSYKNSGAKVLPLSALEFRCFVNKNRLAQVALDNIKNEKVTEHEKTITQVMPNYQTDLEVKHNHYYLRDKTYQKISDQAFAWSRAQALYNKVENEMDEALDALSSASTMETVDLFSKNKGISIASSMYNSSAQSELEDISPAVQDLMQQLKLLQKENSVLVKTLEVDDTFDLVTDLAFDFSFDFTSVLSLMNLSRATDDVEELKEKLAPVGGEITKAVKDHQELQSEYLNKLA